VVNAAHMHAVPGRKTDARDAEWIADLLQHGLLRASFIPSQEQRELRDLTRTRTSLIDERSATVNRIQKVLEDANIKLAGVATDIMGKSGRDILAALVGGEADAAAMAALARGKLRRKREALEQALRGRMSDHHRLLIALHLEHVDLLDEQIARLSAEIAERLHPYEAALLRLETIPGVGRRTAEILAAEMGLEMGRFPTAGHLASWAGMCPGLHESAGKRKSGQRREGNKALRRALTEAAQAAARTKKPGRTYLRGQYRRLVVRCGKKKAAVAVGHTILRLAHYLLVHETTYQEQRLMYLDERRRARTQQRALDQLKALGYDVTLTPRAPAA
jgi:transposase